MNALDKFNRDQIIEEIALNGGDFFHAPAAEEKNCDFENAESVYEQRFVACTDQAVSPDVFARITGISQPRKPYGRWLDDRPMKVQKNKHRYKHFAWDDPDEEDLHEDLW